MDSEIRIFEKELAKFANCRRCGILCGELAHCAAIFLLGLAVYVFADFFIAFSPTGLKIMNIVLLCVAVWYLLARAVSALKISHIETASYLDGISGNKRQQIQSACELSRGRVESDRPGGMTGYLLDRVICAANSDMKKFSFAKVLPYREMKRRFRLSLLIMIAACVPVAISFQPSKVILSRIFNPSKDIPPYSSYEFTISPDEPSVIYGESIELSCSVGGAPVTKTVLLRLKQGNKTSSVSCFKDLGGGYGQHLEKLTSPLEFCFSIGKARSRWTAIEVLTQPRIAMAQVRVSPPEYTRQNERDFVLGKDSLKVFRGSKISLTVTSNRPLMSGTMLIATSGENKKIIAAEKGGANSVVFNWNAEKKAEVIVNIRDLRGTLNSSPLEFQQAILEDENPSISITEPDAFFMATPDVEFTIRGYAEDDIGLRRVDLLRSIVGFRDRMSHLGPELVARRWDFSEELDLSALGLLPGQTLEFYAEANDFNPSMTGSAVSEIIRVKIISDEEYADILRLKTRVETIFYRHHAAMEAFKELQNLLKEFKSSLEEGSLNDESIKQSITNLDKANSQARELLRMLAEDFPIYEMEKEQREFFNSLYMQTMMHSEAISAMGGKSDEELIFTVGKMLEDFESAEQAAGGITEKFEAMESLSRIFKAAGEFAALTRLQRDVAQRLSRFRSGMDTPHSAMLRSLAGQEEEIAARMEKLRSDIAEIAKTLPSEFNKLRKDALFFSNSIHELNIIPELQKAHASAESQQGNRAYMHAQKALELMLLLEKDDSEYGENAFANMLKGKIPGETPCGIAETARQMLNTILRQQKSGGQGIAGAGTVAGGGGVGDGSDGFSVASSSMLDIPVKGPGRSELPGQPSDKHSHTRGPAYSREGQGTAFMPLPEDAVDVITDSEGTTLETGAVALDEAPFKYIEAVKKYFGIADAESNKQKQ